MAATLTGHRRGLWHVAFSPDGHTLASASSDRTVGLWDVASRRLLRQIRLDGAATAIAFDRAGTTLATGDGSGQIRLWNPQTGEPLADPIVPYQLTVLYQPPRDPAVFDEYYDKTHTPLVVKIPGLRSFVVSRPGPDLGGGSSAYYLVAVLGFDSEDAAQAAMVGPEGSAVLADLENFAQAGFVAMTGPSTVIV